MLRYAGSGPPIQHNFATVVDRLRVECLQQVPRVRAQALEAVGVQVVSWAVQDFRTKARGGADPGGISWRELTEGAIISRLTKRAPYRTAIAEKKALRQQAAPLLDELRRKLPPGKDAGRRRQRSAIARQFEAEHPQLGSIRKRRAAINKRQRGMIDREMSNHEIGVDTGRLLNSLVYGRRELSRVRVPRQRGGEAPPPAIFDVKSTGVTVGSVLNYAEYFDSKRPIFSAASVTGERHKALLEILQRFYERAIKQGLGDE